eukprot:TRINITY_DN5131_c0_g1_i1.p1 TRINITY_DN5131_c0_g1~~TRINITY_DN5131_c0_g1_i1.p1  ORF type:complete len:113 (+),score=17.31 TRINITY_DN5131_c0_g1_i1:223-561(+)
MLILVTMEGIMMWSLMLRDIEKVMYMQEHAAGDVSAAIIPYMTYRTVRDPAIMVRLGGTDPLHAEPLREEKISEQSLQRLSSTVVRKPGEAVLTLWWGLSVTRKKHFCVPYP